MTHKEDIWKCSECEQEYGRHDLYFDGICEECNSKILTEEERRQVANFIAVKSREIKVEHGLKNINGGFCTIDFNECDGNELFFTIKVGSSDDGSSYYRTGELVIDRENIHTEEEVEITWYEQVSQDFGEEQTITKL